MIEREKSKQVESRMSEERRRRRRIKRGGEEIQQKPILLLKEIQETTANEEMEQELATNLAIRTELRENPDPFTSRDGINEIRSGALRAGFGV